MTLNMNLNVSATEAEVGKIVYINGDIAGWWGYVFFADEACTNSIYKNDIYGKVVIKDKSTDGLPYWGNSIVGNNEPGSYRQYCENATSVDVSDINVSVKTSMDTCFRGCQQLRKIIGLDKWNPINTTSTSNMFMYAKRLVDLGDISKWKMPSLTSANGMFRETGLLSVDLHDWYTPNLTNVADMFTLCTALRVVDISGIDTTYVTSASNMFGGNNGLQYVIMDSDDIKFSGNVSMPNPNNTCKFLVKASMIDSYKSHANWSSRASRIESIDNYNIVRVNGQITVTPKEV